MDSHKVSVYPRARSQACAAHNFPLSSVNLEFALEHFVGANEVGVFDYLQLPAI